MPRTLTYDLQPSAPRLVLPPHACDAHVHVFGPMARFPFAGVARPPGDAPKETLFALHRQLGIARCVIVQSQVHGFDNRVVEDAIAAGEGRYLGIALLPFEVPDAELSRLAAAGFRGVRFHFTGPQVAAQEIAQVLRFAERLQPLGMHLQLHLYSHNLQALAAPLAHSAVPVVLDHMARIDAARGLEDGEFRLLHGLLRNPLFHVKLSGVDRITRGGEYAPGVPFAAMLLRDYQQQCLWGTDWPHPNQDHVPDDGALVDLLEVIAPDPAALAALLVHNPQRLYRFPA